MRFSLFLIVVLAAPTLAWPQDTLDECPASEPIELAEQTSAWSRAVSVFYARQTRDQFDPVVVSSRSVSVFYVRKVSDQFSPRSVLSRSVSLEVVDSPCDPGGCEFRRGYVDGNDEVSIVDALGILEVIFLGEPTTCEDALDVNDSGDLSILDAFLLLTYLFAGGDEPAAPFGECGPDLTPDSLTCEFESQCL